MTRAEMSRDQTAVRNNQTNGTSSVAACDVPLCITIVGAGIGGLAAAIFLRRQGHRVTVRRSGEPLRESGYRSNFLAGVGTISACE